MMAKRVAILAGALALLAGPAAPAPAAGQVSAGQVETVGTSDVALDRRLDRLLAADPLVITTETRIREGDTIPRSVLVLDATLVHEGTILGDLVLVDAGAFLRPGAVVEGDLVNIGGGLYRSPRARIGGRVMDLPDAEYRVVRAADRVVIEASGTPSRLTLDGPGGVRTPTYDRANGVGVALGGSYRLPHLGDATPLLRAHGGWRTEPGKPMYGASLELRWRAWSVDGGYEKGWATHDDWVFGDLRNSLNYLWDGDDFRNYYGTEQTWAAVTRLFGDEAKSFHGQLRVAGRIEDAESLPGGDPWHLRGTTARPNPAVDDGRTSSVTARFDVAWHGQLTAVTAGAEYEVAGEWQDGRTEFERFAAWTEVAMRGPFGHTLEVWAFGQLPVAGDTLPRQRWTIVGGPGTLQTLPVGRHAGDHVLMVESRYRIPSPEALALPILGAPELQLVHAAGMAWLGDEDRRLTQEVGGRLQFFGLYVQYMVQPDATERDEVVVGLSWPFEPGYPWEL